MEIKSFNSLHTIQNEILKVNKELSSGKKSVESDPAGHAMADRMKFASKGFEQALRNVDQAQGVVEVGSSGLSSIHDSVSKVKELTLQYKNTSSPEDKEIIQQQIQAELDNIDSAAASKDGNGNQLLNGNQTITVQAGDSATDTISITGADLSTDGLDLSSFNPDDADAIQQLDDAARSVELVEGRFASTANRLEGVKDSLYNRIEASEAARSRVEDVDVAEATARKTKYEILEKYSLALSKQSNGSLQSLQSLMQPPK